MKKNVNKKLKTKILFLCTGNTCRSPMAEQIFKDYLRKKRLLSKFDVKSAGLFADIGGCMTDYAAQAVADLGIKIKTHIPRQFNSKLAQTSDIIICMTQNHKNRLDEKTRAKAFSFAEITGGRDLNDPYGLGPEQYCIAAEYIVCSCEDILKLVEKISLKY